MFATFATTPSTNSPKENRFDKKQISIPKVINFDTHTNKENWLDSSAADWVKFVPNLSKFDIVVSDNCIPCARRGSIV